MWLRVMTSDLYIAWESCSGFHFSVIGLLPSFLGQLFAFICFIFLIWLYTFPHWQFDHFNWLVHGNDIWTSLRSTLPVKWPLGLCDRPVWPDYGCEWIAVCVIGLCGPTILWLIVVSVTCLCGQTIGIEDRPSVWQGPCGQAIRVSVWVIQLQYISGLTRSKSKLEFFS